MTNSDKQATGPEYDYTNQCWVIDGIIQPCNHPEHMGCTCYGKIHAGETATKESK